MAMLLIFVLLGKIEQLAKDVEIFAQLAGWKSVNMEDVILLGFNLQEVIGLEKLVDFFVRNFWRSKFPRYLISLFRPSWFFFSVFLREMSLLMSILSLCITDCRSSFLILAYIIIHLLCYKIELRWRFLYTFSSLLNKLCCLFTSILSCFMKYAHTFLWFFFFFFSST